MADDKSMPDTNTHEGLGAMSEEQIKEMEGIVRDTDHPYKDPITGKMNVDVPEDKLGVSKKSEHDKKAHADREKMVVDKEEELINANEWEDPLKEDH